MPHIVPPSLDELDPETRASLEKVIAERGAVPQARLILARRPKIMGLLNELSRVVMNDGTVDPGLKYLVALMSSAAAGCRHCQAQTAFGAHHHTKVPEEKVEAVWEFETSPLFDDAERAALRLARDASLSPSAATAEHFEDLRETFDEGELVEIMTVICLFGWNNRWNDSVATATDPRALAFSEQHIASWGWEAGKHAQHSEADQEKSNV